eukprot:m.180759 g.180759  ORF g.180759 m.180759 type:complete len:817 (-) comp32035_c1_seq2:48-2498(-)
MFAMMRVMLTVMSVSVVSTALIIDGDTPWVVAGEVDGLAFTGDSLEGTAYDMAQSDVQKDWYKVFGYTAPIVKTATPPTFTQPAVYFGTLEQMPWLTSQFDLSACELHLGAEAHCVVVRNGSLIATGNGTRGAIYALYMFAEELLGVDPWHHFSQQQPPFLGHITVAPDLAIVMAPPKFTYRGIFTNDEDMLGYSRKDPLGKNVYDLTTADQIYETTLRMKANLVIPGTSTNPDESHIALASRRGLAIHQSHFEIVGFAPFMWLDGDAAPRNSYNWTEHPDLMSHVWRAAIDAQKDFEVVWTVGLRGLWDYEYCDKATSQEKCGELISTAMANQTAWIREVQPHADIVTYLWGEGLGLYTAGVLKIPEGVKILFTDRGHGYIGGLGDLKNATGVYYHTAMLDGSANQVSEMVPPSRIFSEFAAFIANCSETFLIVDNVSDLWPVLLSTEAVLRLAWDPKKFSGNANTTQMQFFKDFSTRMFGQNVSSAVAEIYLAYFTLPHVVAGRSDEFMGETLRKLSGSARADLKNRGNMSNTTILLAQQTLQGITPSLKPCTDALAAAMALQPSIQQHNRQFYDAHVVYQTSLQNFGIVAIEQLAMSILGFGGSNATDSLARAQAAMDALTSLFASQRTAEGSGSWRGLFAGDRLSYAGLQDTRRAVLNYQRILINGTSEGVVGGDPSGYYSFYDYQKVAIENYPLINANPKFKTLDFVMMNCSSPTCVNGADGGVFSGASTVSFWSTRCRDQDGLWNPQQCVADGLKLLYTTDGSVPTSGSTMYKSPITLTATTTIMASVETNGTLHPLVHNATFIKSATLR